MDPARDLIEAVKAGDVARVRELVAATPALAAARGEDGLSAVLLAAYHRRGEVLSVLLDCGPWLSLWEAAAVGHATTVAEQLDAQPKRLNKPAADGFTPLGLAAFFGHLDTVTLLLSRGADPNLPSANGQSIPPLCSAVAGGHLEIARALLAAGADANARQAGGFTPLHGAANAGNVDLVRLLLTRGADAASLTDEGRTAAAIAREKGHLDLAGLLDGGRAGAAG